MRPPARTRRELTTRMVALTAVAVLCPFAAAQDQPRNALVAPRVELRVVGGQGVRIMQDPATGEWIGISQAGFDLSAASRLPTAEELAMVPIDQSLRDLIASLDRADYRQREAAMRALLSETADLLQIYAVLELEHLSAEQRCRLLQIVRNRLMLAPRGALGVRWNPRLNNMNEGVEITDLIDGMPAQRVLRVGDRITHIDGKRLGTELDMSMAIQARAPGEVVTLTFQRPRRDDRGAVVRTNDGQIIFDTHESPLALSSVERLTELSDQASQVVGIVQQQRIGEAQAATKRFAPPVRQVVIPARQRVVASQSSSRDPDAVDQHELIARLLRERALFDSGNLVVTPQHRRYWMTTLRDLSQWAGEPGLDPRERDYRFRVMRRYQQLMP